jgi:hypothetical protein
MEWLGESRVFVKRVMAEHIVVSELAANYYDFLTKLTGKWLGDEGGLIASNLVTGLQTLESARPKREESTRSSLARLNAAQRPFLRYVIKQAQEFIYLREFMKAALIKLLAQGKMIYHAPSRRFAAGAIVVDVGGPLSHGSIAAREHGIPGVLNVGMGTRTVRTGQMITVGGGQGKVYLRPSEK